MIKIIAGNNFVKVIDNNEELEFHSFNERSQLIAMLQSVIYAARYRNKEPIELHMNTYTDKWEDVLISKF